MIWNMLSTAASTIASSSSNETAIQVETNQVSPMLILLPAIAVAAGSITATYLYSNSNKLSGFKRSWKMSLSKLKVVAICLILPLTFLAIVPSVAASSTVVQSISASSLKPETYISQAAYTSNDTNFNNQEISCSQDVGSNITNDYENVGVDAGIYDFAASNGNSAWNIVTSNIQMDESYQDVSVFAFGNGINDLINNVPYEEYYLSDGGENLTPSDISTATNGGTAITFAWMWMCMGAGPYPGDPYLDFASAWTQVQGLSEMGFNYPDSSGACFIGFQGQAPMISENSFSNSAALACNFIDDFYEAASNGQTVFNSINIASETLFGVPYDWSPLATGYYAWWPGGNYMNGNYLAPGYYIAGCMAVFGDPNICISPGPTSQETVTAPTVSGSYSGTTGQIDVCSTDSDSNYVAYLIDWGNGYTSPLSSYTPSGQQVTFNYNYGSNGNYLITVYAESTTGVWSNPGQCSLTVGTGNYITVDAVDNYCDYQGPVYPNVYIDGVNYGQAPVSVYVSNGYHNVTLDDPTWDPCWSADASFQYMYDQNFNYYSNGAFIYIDSPEYLEAVYYLDQ